jgi:4-hydroxyphenylacetate 3-hydroxylase N terminal
MLMTGKEYLQSIRDGRILYVGKERVHDQTMHPAFAGGARTYAALFDLKSDPALRDIMSFDDVRGFTHVRSPSGGCPGLRSGVDLSIGHKDEAGNSPCRGCAPAIARGLSSPDHAPAQAPCKCLATCQLLLLRTAHLSYLAARSALATSRAAAQTKPASSRATAVMATVFSLPLLSSAR